MTNTNNVVDNLLEAQKKAAEKVAETTKKFYGENSATSALEKGKDLYNEWLNKQKATFESFQEKTTDSQKKSKETIENSQSYLNNWMEGQMNTAKNMWEMNQNFMKNMAPNANTMKNPMDWFNNTSNLNNSMTEGMKNYNNFINQANNFKQWNDMMNKFNPSQFGSNNNDWMTSMPAMFTSYFETINTSFEEMQKNFKNASSQDIYSNLSSNAMTFGKFAEIWAPFMKSIQEKTFTAEEFKSMLNIKSVKEMTDNMFNFMPESVSTHFNQMMEQSKASMQSMTGMTKEQWAQGKEFMNSNNPFANMNPFGANMDQMNQFNEWFKGAISPIAKMITPNKYTKSAAAWSSIYDKFAVYTVKNAELKYLMYVQSNKVFEKLADRVVDKIDSKEEVNSLTEMYQEWLNIGDTTYVELFESEDYSKLMAEVSAVQLKLKKEMDLQMEAQLGQYPIATKSELDELYKIIYDLKKEVRQLEKMMELDVEPVNVEINTFPTAASKKATNNPGAKK